MMAHNVCTKTHNVLGQACEAPIKNYQKVLCHMSLLCRHHSQHAKVMACGVQESAIATAKHRKSQDCSIGPWSQARGGEWGSWRLTSSSPGQLDPYDRVILLQATLLVDSHGLVTSCLCLPPCVDGRLNLLPVDILLAVFAPV